MANIFMRFPGMRERALTFSYDDGVETDIRFIEILKKHGMKATFNINSSIFAPEGKVYPAGTVHRRMSRSQVLATYTDSGMEVATHADHHAWPAHNPPAVFALEMLRDREQLEAMFGGIIDGSAYPYGEYNEEVKSILRACGIVYARTVRQTETFALPTDWLEWNSTCHHDNPRLTELGEKFLNDKIQRDPYLFYVWGHTYEFDGKIKWDVIEKFAAQVGDRPDIIWYATNHEIYDYVTAFRRMVFSADGTVAYNPTVQTLCFVNDGSPVELRPGELKKI